MVTGYGSRDTPEQNELIDLDNHLRRGAESLTDVATYARKLGIDKIVVFPGDYPAEVRTRIMREADRVASPVVFKNSEGIIVQLGSRNGEKKETRQ
jgi:sugar phosphate isomerase/epimerase